MNLKWIGLLAIVCFAMLSVDAGKVSFKMGDGTKRTIYAGANLWGGQTIMVTRSTKVDGHVTFTRFFYNVHTFPVLRAAVRKVTGSFDLGNKTVSNVDATAVTHVLWLPRMVLYHESNNIPGLQLNDTISQGNVYNLAPIISGGSFTWTTDISNYDTTDGVRVYVISACGTSSSTGGSACFYFHTGNGTYTRSGVTVYPGEFKIDKVWTLGTAIKTKISTANAANAPLRMALVGYVVSSTDTIDNGTFAKQDSNGAVTAGSNSVEIEADYTIQFTSGDTGYVNVNKTCIFVHAGAANETVDILMREIDLTASVSGSASTSITITGNQFGTYAGSGSFSSVRTRKVFVWSFMSDLTNDLSQIVWDPTIGTSDQNGNAASFASASLLLVSFLAILGVLMGKLY